MYCEPGYEHLAERNHRGPWTDEELRHTRMFFCGTFYSRFQMKKAIVRNKKRYPNADIQGIWSCWL